MARTAITPVAKSAAGVIPTAVDVAAELTDGNSFPWTENAEILIINGDDAAVVPTFVNPATVGPNDLAGASIPAGSYGIYGPFDASFRQPDGSVHVNYAGTTPSNVTVVVLR